MLQVLMVRLQLLLLAAQLVHQLMDLPTHLTIPYWAVLSWHVWLNLHKFQITPLMNGTLQDVILILIIIGEIQVASQMVRWHKVWVIMLWLQRMLAVSLVLQTLLVAIISVNHLYFTYQVSLYYKHCIAIITTYYNLCMYVASKQ